METLQVCIKKHKDSINRAIRVFLLKSQKGTSVDLKDNIYSRAISRSGLDYLKNENFQII